MAAFGVVELGLAMYSSRATSILTVLDLFQRLWRCYGTYRLDVRDGRKAKGLRRIPLVGRLSMDFALFLWAAYNDHLLVAGFHRATAYARMTRVMDIRRKDPRAIRVDYKWIPDAAPSAHDASTTMRRTQKTN